MTARDHSWSPALRTVAICALLLWLTGCEYFVSAESRYQRAQEFIAQGEYRRALIELKNALDKQPDMQPARLLLADVALWLGDASSAGRELGKASPAQDPVHYADLQTRIDLALGRHQAVLDRLTADAGHIPAARAAYYRGAALLELKQAAAAESQLRAAIAADPALVEAKVALCESIAGQNELARALEVSGDVVREHPDSALAWLMRGTLLARRGENSRALQALERAHDLAPRQLEFVRKLVLLVGLTDVRLAQRNVEQARVSSDELARLAPGSPIALITASRVLMAANDNVAAAASLHRVVNANPQLTQARFLLAVTLLAQGNLGQAGQELGAVIDQVPGHIEARQLLAQVRMRQNDPDGAMQVLVPALQSGPDDPRLSLLMDAARAKSGRSGPAADLLERALQDAPDNQALQRQLAAVYLQTGQAEKALTLLRKAPGSSAAGVQREALMLQAIVDARGAAAARAEVDAMVAAHPSDASVIGLAAAFYEHIGDAAAARRLLGDALQKDARNTALLFTLSQLELSARRPAGARSALTRLLEVDPKHSVARLMLAQVDITTGDLAGAAAGLEILRKSEPSAALPRLLLARLALMRDDDARADALIDEAVKVAPAQAEVHSAAGALYLSNGRYDQAIAHFHKGVDIDPSNAALWLSLGRAQQALGQDGAARESVSRALTLKPDWLPAEGALVFIDLQSGQRAAAVDRVARLQQKYPQDAAVMVLAGDAYATLRDYAEAARSFDAAARIQPSGPLALKAYEARRAGQHPNPTEPLEQWLEQHPDDLISRRVLADAYTLAGDRRRAVQQYERIIDAQPSHVASLNNLAWLYFELSDRRATEVARKAYALAPAAVAVGDTLGWILVESGLVDEGLPILKTAAAGKGTSPEIRYHYAVALARSGSNQAAKVELERVLADHGGFPSRAAAEQLRDRLKSGAGMGT